MKSDDFYPTPIRLIMRMIRGINFREVSHILEPSAGKGDICDILVKRTQTGYRRPQLDVIEIDEDLRHILRGKNLRIVHDDFLTFKTQTRYDLIIANFPFSTGEHHLSKAIDMLSTTGGRLVCLVNAETLRNTYTKCREANLARLGKAADFSVDYIEGAFTSADRKTDVEVALIDATFAEPENRPSLILDGLKRSMEYEAQALPQTEIANRVTNFKTQLIDQFKVETGLGVTLLEEYFRLRPFIKSSLSDRDDDRMPTIRIKIDNDDYIKNLAYAVNLFLTVTRRKYWNFLLSDGRFRNRYTNNVLNTLHNQIDELEHCDFTEFNIEQLEAKLRLEIRSGVEAAMIHLFERFTRGHAYGQDFDEGNIHYYNGWKTNKAHKVNNRVIIPLHGFSSWGNSLDYQAIEDLRDMAKVFDYLAGDPDRLKLATNQTVVMRNHYNAGEWVDLRYFKVKLYKKGTCHITFTDQHLLDKFNIFAGQRKNWLPPRYSKAKYEDMTPDEKAVIDDFQGKEEYEKVCAEPEKYIVNTDTLLLEGSIRTAPAI